MSHILQALNDEWSTLAPSPRGHRAVRRWTTIDPVFLGAIDLHDVLRLGFDPDAGPSMRRTLAGLAPNDDTAARTLLQAFLGGLCNLARQVGRDADATDEVISLAWERIRTYPIHRPGSVSGNVMLDVRKRYLRLDVSRAETPVAAPRCAAVVAAAEDEVLDALFVNEFRCAAATCGVSDDALATILRSRVGGESMLDLAAEQAIPVKRLWHRRWRAEVRLRDMPLAS